LFICEQYPPLYVLERHAKLWPKKIYQRNKRNEMKKVLKKLIKKTPFYHPLRNCLHKKLQKIELRKWENSGHSGLLPHIIKQRILGEYARQYNLKIFVETGTYYGDMVEAMRNLFDKIYSIELSQEFYIKAKKRFKSEKNIKLIQGNSGKELQMIMKEIDKPALFWLDGHYSGGATERGEKDTPIWEELRSILAEQNLGHVIIIDDARLFGTDPAYPTIEKVKEFIYSKRETVQMTVDDDSIRIIL
jgi:hypothetical protein